MEMFNWAHFALLDNLSSFGNSLFAVSLDGMRNIIDASAGGTWNGQNLLTGLNSGCGGLNWDNAITAGNPVQEGNSACFNMGSKSQLYLNNFDAGTSRGDIVTFSGGGVHMSGRTTGQVGQAADGGDYYQIHLTGNDPNAVIAVQSVSFGGRPGDVHSHGIVADFRPGLLSVTNSVFGNQNENISSPYGVRTIISGNYSVATTGPQSVILTGVGDVTWVGNQFDKPPLATVVNCGTGAVVKGTLRGTISTGAGSPTLTSCQLQLPISPHSPDSNGACTFSNTTALITAGSIGAPPLWNLSSGANNIAGEQLNFNCGSE